MHKRWVVLGILAVVLVFAGVWAMQSSKTGQSMKAGSQATQYICPMHPQVVSDKPGDCPICQMRLVPKTQNSPSPQPPAPSKRVRFYRHPMRPDVSSPVPAKDDMGMDYVPVYEDETTTVQDPKEVCVFHDCPMVKEGRPCPMLIIAQKGEKVECPVCKERIETAASAGQAKPLPLGYASVLISPQKQQLIGIRTNLVEKKKVSKLIQATGRVAYDPELYQAQAEYLQTLRSAKENAEWAKSLLDSARTKLVRLGVNDAMIQEMEAQQSPDKSLITAVSGGKAWVYADIYEYEVPLVHVGDRLQVELPTQGGTRLEGLIRSIDTVVNAETRTVRVRAQVSNENGFLKPDMYVRASLAVDLGEAIFVPEEAVFFTGSKNLVFVDQGNGLFEPREVKLGQQAGDFYEVKEGLEEGERVVSNGNFLLDSESRLKAALTDMSTAHSHGS